MSNSQHDELITALAAQVKQFYKQRKAFKVYHGSTNSTRVLQFDQGAMVDVSGFNRVLSVDAKHKVAIVEPNVSMDQLVEATLKHGLVPPVVMEFPGITVGGGLQGGAGESNSFKWGTFNCTLNWFDIMLANGRVVRASPKEHADLFWGAAGAYGSLGVVTCAEVQLVPAKQYVNLTYTPVHSFQEAVDALNTTDATYDYIDGIQYAKDCGVIMTGRLNDKPTGRVQTFRAPSDPWFYLHAEQLARSDQVHKKAIPIRDYLFRYDRGAFWMGREAFTRLKTPFNAVTRRLLDPLLHTRRMYEALQASGVSQECIIQDVAMPAQHAIEFLDYLHKTFTFYPLWLCPLAADQRSPLLSSALPAKQLINVGVWSLYRKPQDEFIRANRRLERNIKRLGGKKWLYAQSFFTEKEFWAMYDKKWYDRLRKKYHAETLPNVYQKIAVKKFAKVNAKRGVLLTMLGRKGIRIRK